MAPTMSTTPRFLAVDRDVIQHPVERRGFVTVPLDYARPQAETIDIFYRLIPRHGRTVDDPGAPVIVVINGGPGIPASFYRPLDFDYVANAPRQPGAFDRFAFLLRDYRVLLVDQRGTAGLSAPLDLDDPDLDADLVARLFSSDVLARDYLAAIEAAIPAGEPFYIIGQSYGGMPGMQYLALPNTRVPNGIVFSSSALPFEDPIATGIGRRTEQLRLNLHLRSAVPDIAERLERTRAHLAAVGVEPWRLDGLYTALGKDVTGVWEPALTERLGAICAQTRAEILHDFVGGLEDTNLLNYILSSANFTPGHTDRTLAAHTSEQVPLEPWMLDENRLLMRTGQDGSWRQELIARMDAAPPAATAFPSLDALKAGLARTQALFTAADDDAFVPRDRYREHVALFEVPGHTALETLPGGHHAIFLEAGYHALRAWATGPAAKTR